MTASPRRRWLRAGLVASAVLLLLYGAWRLHVLHHLGALAEAARRAGPAGALLVFLGLAVLALLLVPMIPLVVACGFIYGLPGVLLSLPAATLSATLAFLAGRAVGRRAFAQAIASRPRVRALAELTEEGGLVSVALLRVSPLLPFTPGNVLLGLTALRLRDLVLGTVLGMLPGALLYTSAGALLPDPQALERGEVPKSPWFWAVLALGLASMAVMGGAAARKLRARARSTEGGP